MPVHAEGLRDRKKRLTRYALSRAAVDLVARHGLDHVTVEDISAAADVSPRTFFNYFATKEEAVLAPDPEAGPRIRALVLAQPAELSAVAAVREALLAEIAAEVAVDRESWLRRMRVVQQHPVLLAKVLAGGEAVEREVVAAVAERVGRSEDDTYPLLLGAATGAAFRVAVARWSRTDESAPLHELIAEALDLLAAGLANPPQP
ncbi:TetR/AcrR family transcriptional regulator [Saccharothrix yanglingensis]|uniref:TetR family transcriptional regulator n=1 Tax=Saccharothrix yanglingensis TaxID=659496 RepID=A0ABU0X9C6_9PSEU|nr:TetR family transcriptional regulator [Saccharothrix yanglingensis]MDQ2588744.1 TetR family transcriptional regulator [Saccharothrix yanglingensis]